MKGKEESTSGLDPGGSDEGDEEEEGEGEEEEGEEEGEGEGEEEEGNGVERSGQTLSKSWREAEETDTSDEEVERSP